MQKQHTPKLRNHKGTGQAYIELSGRRFYLGKWGTPEAQKAYDKKLAEWRANGCELKIAKQEITVLEIAARYMDHVETYYRKVDGTPSSQQHNIKNAIKPAKETYGALEAVKFGPVALRAIRDKWISDNLSRKTVNDYVSELRRMFEWAVSFELIPANVHEALKTVKGLRRGRSKARETRPVMPVPQADIDAIKDLVSAQVWALIQLQLLMGARSGELLKLRPCDINMSGPVWTAQIQDHKTAHYGHRRILYFGPQAQSILKPWLLRPADAFLFSPLEAEIARHKKDAEGHREKWQKPNPRKTDRIVRDHYTPDTYGRAITRACAAVNTERKAKKEDLISLWHPHQLRHNCATAIRARYGLEAAQTALGHTCANVTQIYAERDQQLAQRVMSEIG